MIDFTPYINKKEMSRIALRIREIFAEAYGDEVTYLQDQSIDYNGWVVTFSGSITDGEIEMDELTFSPAFPEQANQIIYL